mmetsp:Transcript_35538/g.46760  ORF Transcript_35538/g.46760 Transcript_35538/m.46760 type:complete len:105 (+) Transcript_35538:1198-1512(+)
MQEGLRLQRSLDLSTPADRYISMLALDIVLSFHKITEAQFKRIMYEIDEMETVNEVQSVYSTEMRNNEDMRSHYRIIDGVSGKGSMLRSRPASGLNHSRPTESF